MPKKRHYIYILKCNDDSYYTGYATDVVRRLKEHNGELGNVGARYTRPRRPVTLIHQEYFYSRSKAQKREAEIKKLSRLEKEELIKRNTQTPSPRKKKAAL